MSRVRTVVATEILLLLGLAGLVGVCYLVERVGGLDDPLALLPIPALFLAALPGALWLGYFHSQDRFEPEPKLFVFGAAILGAFVAGPTAAFLLGEALPDTSIAPPEVSVFSGTKLLHAFLIVGLLQELTKYLVIRYSVYRSPEFDEPMDGVVYMTAAGIGFASFQNYIFLRGQDGSIFLSAGVAHVVVNTLAHACFAGFLGFALGLAKFWAGKPLTRQLVLLAGLLCASLLNGLYGLIRDVVVISGLEITPWRGVAFGFGFAAAIFLALSFMMHRLVSRSPHRI